MRECLNTFWSFSIVLIRCLHSKVSRADGEGLLPSYIFRTETIETVRKDVVVWTKGSAGPPTDEGVLRLPFRLRLDNDVEPSCKYSDLAREGDVSYVIAVFGKRNGSLASYWSVVRPFAVVPPDYPGLQLRRSLLSGWSGPVRTISKSNNIRRGMWGSYAKSKAEVRLSQYLMFSVAAHF